MAHPILWPHNRAIEAFLMKRGIASIARNPLTTTQWPQNKNLPRTLVADILARNVPRRKARSPHFCKRLRSIGQSLIYSGTCWCCGSCPSGCTIACPRLLKVLRVQGNNQRVISKDIHRPSHRQSLGSNPTLSQNVFGNITTLTWGFVCLEQNVLRDNGFLVKKIEILPNRLIGTGSKSLFIDWSQPRVN